MTQIPIIQHGLGGGGGAAFNVLQGGAGQSTSTPRFMMPDIPSVGRGFQELQGGIGSNQLQQQAIGEQRGLRGTLDSLLSSFGQGERGRIEEAFGTASKNVSGALRSRGFAGSSLNLPGQLGVEREKELAVGDLQDRILGRRMDFETGISKNISDLLFGSSEQATNLLGGILGSGGIGNVAQSTTSVPGGGGGGGISRNPWRVVGCSGSGATKHHTETIRELKDRGFKIILAPDSDEAGMKMLKKFHKAEAITHYTVTGKADVDWNDLLKSTDHESFAKWFLGGIKTV